MKSTGRIRKLTVLAIAFVCLVVLSASAYGTNLNVYCGGKHFPNTIKSALKILNPAGPNTLTVFGTCNENVLVRGFNRLTLISTTGATINDASGGTGVVVNIDDSTGISLQGFTIKGGNVGISCANFSVCRFDGNTVQEASGGGISLNIQSHATLGSNTIQNNVIGLGVGESSYVRSWGGNVIQNNLWDGVVVDYGSSFGSFGDTIQNNAGNGIASYNHGFLLLLGTTITGNTWQGVALLGQSSADFEFDNVITGNGYDGVLVRDLSYAEFRGANTITGNLILDVECQDYFTVVRGVTNIGGGITNCTNASAPQPFDLNRPRTRPPTPNR